MKYRKTADEDARQVPPLTPGWHEFGPLSLEEIAAWCGGQVFTNESGSYIAVPDFEGDKRAWPGDWIVEVVPGKFCKVTHEDYARARRPVTKPATDPELAARYLAEANRLLDDFRREDLAFINDMTGRAAMPQYSTWAARMAAGLNDLITILEQS